MTAKDFFKKKYGNDPYFACFHDSDMINFANEYNFYKMFELITLTIKNLRRGDDLENSKELFFELIKANINEICKDFDLRWLISVVDTYADHGTELEKSNAMIISTYANMIKIADTAHFLVSTNNGRRVVKHKEVKLLQGVVYMYDGINSLQIKTDDMPNILFYRIDDRLKHTPELWCLFEEIKKRFAQHSPVMQIANYHKGFYDKLFFEDRKTFRK
jgi:hypothetical protein